MSSDYLLDTHTWLWFIEGTRSKVSARCISAIHRACLHDGVLVSALSVWELANLEARGRVKLGRGCREWVRNALGQPGVRLAELTPEIAIDGAGLKGLATGDPVDRLLIATARHYGATLVTRDERILDYGAAGHVRVMDAG